MRNAELLALLTLCACTSKPAVPPLRVAAAADLTEAFTSLAHDYEQETGVHVDLVFSASGLLSRQLTEGAPFDVFASANQAFAEATVKSGTCDGATLRPLARGALVLLPAGVSLQDLVGRDGRIALANPEQAPYGRAAKDALERAGVWDQVKPRVVFTQNVRAALRAFDTGDAAFAFVALGNVIDRQPRPVPLDATQHAPLVQYVVQCKGSGQRHREAAAFLAFLERATSKTKLSAHGFRVDE